MSMTWTYRENMSTKRRFMDMFSRESPFRRAKQSCLARNFRFVGLR